MSRQLTPGAPLPVLVAAYARAGWIGLDTADVRCPRAILDAFTRLLDPRSGQGFVTVSQIADAACYSERHVRTMLAVLEAMGLISWTRGGIREGRPEPSIIRVAKTVLLDLIRRARPALERIRAIRAERTAARLKGLRMLTIRPRNSRRSKGSAHAATAASPSPYRGRDASGPSRPDHEKEISMHDKTSGKTSCDNRACTSSTRRPEFDAWTIVRGRHYCPTHSPLNEPEADPEPNEMSDAALALTNRCRRNAGLPPLVRSLI